MTLFSCCFFGRSDEESGESFCSSALWIFGDEWDEDELK